MKVKFYFDNRSLRAQLNFKYRLIGKRNLLFINTITVGQGSSRRAVATDMLIHTVQTVCVKICQNGPQTCGLETLLHRDRTRLVRAADGDNLVQESGKSSPQGGPRFVPAAEPRQAL